MAKPKVQTITLKVSENTKEKMQKYFEDKKRPKTPPYAVFQADEADTVVTLYESGKAVFQGISADIDANIWKETEKRLNPGKQIEIKKAGEKKKEKPSNNFVYYANTIGSDEVGTGDYFGPIVVSSAYVAKENISFLENLGVKDSKKMTDAEILRVVPEIIKKIPYSTRILNNRDYNGKYSDEVNMNAMKAILHNKVLLDLNEKYGNKADYIVVDQFTYPSAYFKYLAKTANVQKNITFLTKAEDKCLSVACASLISRYVFIKEFNKMSKSVGFDLPKGAGELVDEAAIKIVKQSGFEALNELVKLNFKNTEKIKKALKM